jgi:hypothetical protein
MESMTHWRGADGLVTEESYSFDWDETRVEA